MRTILIHSNPVIICFEEKRKDSLNLETFTILGDNNSMVIEIYCLCTSVQRHSFDCLFVLSIGGKWLFIQWNQNRFFPFATGSLLEAIQPLTKTPEKRRFRLDPTFQWAVSVVPITDNSPRFFS
ncbi:MAG: hypothetical protein EZS28_012893 [Streblomastix strix]|uniref:Uncharacterized protein n=1 Tax=Streblomastix strix TaxID=222440 RepID=A0A5J4WB36_9EUKA|nr:MAG: hypothetical protein EZS28_012893 [Streblomastix strix]